MLQSPKSPKSLNKLLEFENLRENPKFSAGTKHALYCILIRKQDSAFIPLVERIPKLFNAP
jgi:hypothetical protein